MLRPNTSSCPRFSVVIFVCAENMVEMVVFCIVANFMLYISTHSIGTCAGLLHIIVIVIVIVIVIIIIIINMNPKETLNETLKKP